MWIYEGKEIHSHKDLDPMCTDIVYIIYYKNGHQYIGKKTVRSMRRLKPTKKQLAIRKNYVRKEIKDLPFINYEGSSKETEDHEIVEKVIIYQCSNKRTATYLEAYTLFMKHALFDSTYLNQNILGKFFDNAIDGLIEEKKTKENKYDT